MFPTSMSCSNEGERRNTQKSYKKRRRRKEEKKVRGNKTRGEREREREKIIRDEEMGRAPSGNASKRGSRRNREISRDGSLLPCDSTKINEAKFHRIPPFSSRIACRRASSGHDSLKGIPTGNLRAALTRGRGYELACVSRGPALPE